MQPHGYQSDLFLLRHVRNSLGNLLFKEVLMQLKFKNDSLLTTLGGRCSSHTHGTEKKTQAQRG